MCITQHKGEVYKTRKNDYGHKISPVENRQCLFILEFVSHLSTA